MENLLQEMKRIKTLMGLNEQYIIYPNLKGVDPDKSVKGELKTINVKDAIGNEPEKDYTYFRTDKKDYVDNMIKDAKDDGWKSFEPIISIKHPLLSGKYLVIDGNHRLGSFKIGNIPQIKTELLSYDNILLAVPGSEWKDGVKPETMTIEDAKNKNIDLKQYFNTKDLVIPNK